MKWWDQRTNIPAQSLFIHFWRFFCKAAKTHEARWLTNRTEINLFRKQKALVHAPHESRTLFHSSNPDPFAGREEIKNSNYAPECWVLFCPAWPPSLYSTPQNNTFSCSQFWRAPLFSTLMREDAAIDSSTKSSDNGSETRNWESSGLSPLLKVSG